MAFPYACANHAVKITLGNSPSFDPKSIPSNYDTYTVKVVIGPTVTEQTRNLLKYSLDSGLMWSGAFVSTIPPSEFVFFEIKEQTRDKLVLKCYSSHDAATTQAVFDGFIHHAFDDDNRTRVSFESQKM